MLDAIVLLNDRKLFAKGFLSGLTLRCFLPTGNYLQKVSYPTCLYGVSYRQKTIGERFPIRLVSTVFLADRKLFDRRFLDSAALRSK